MRTTALHIISFLLAGMLFYTSTGVSVHKMYCYCKAEFSTSLFCIEDSCAEETEGAEICCTDGICATSDGQSEHNCSDCETETVIFDIDYCPLTTKTEVPVPQEFASTPALFRNLIPQITEIIVFQDTPASLDYNGRKLLPFLQTFLC